MRIPPISLPGQSTEMNGRIIVWYVGASLLFVAALMAVSGVIACFTPGDDSRIPLLYSSFITAAVGVFPLIFVQRKGHRLNYREGNGIVVGAWFSACLFGMLPFLMYGHEFTFVNALFESVSGFTTTGASILNDIEALPKGLQFWRISTAWVGGLGIVTLFSLITQGTVIQPALSRLEVSSIARQSFQGERSRFFTNRMLIIYISLTLATFLALMVTGMPWFDSLTNAMSACSTCGFCTRNESIAFYGNPASQIVLTAAMLLSGIHFGIIFLTFVRKSSWNLFRSEVVHWFLIMVALAIGAVTADLMVNGGYDSLSTALLDASFQVVSISTTTGFATQDTTLWPPLSIAVLLLCALICGCSGSTSGGIKVDRMILSVKDIFYRVERAVTPGLVRKIRVDGASRSAEQVSDATGYIFCYLAILVICALINIACGLDWMTGITASVACIGNVGPGFGDVGSMANYAAIPTLLKCTGMAEMLIGRLEILPILYLLRAIIKR